LHVAVELYRAFDVSTQVAAIVASIDPTNRLRIDLSRPNFIPMGYEGEQLRSETPALLHIPSVPLLVRLESDTSIREATAEMQRVLMTHVEKHRS